MYIMEGDQGNSTHVSLVLLVMAEEGRGFPKLWRECVALRGLVGGVPPGRVNVF